jgi:RNA polymerase sigma factor (sigma-70 family)
VAEAVTGADILADYDRWLNATANRLLFNHTSNADHDDLVQEGRVAMWRALSTFDESRGALPSWLTKAAELRMRDVAWGTGQPFGHEPLRGSRPIEVAKSLDAMEIDEVEALLGMVVEADQHDEVEAAVNELPADLREYVFLRFWAGLDPRSASPGTRSLVKQFPALSDRRSWPAARRLLYERLQHLAA